MALITRYGTLWGQIPDTAGRVFWVAPSASYTVEGRSYSASDDNDGLSPERALRGINRAWNLVSANVGDVIALLPGAHTAIAAGSTTAESITADIAGVAMVGLTAPGNPLRKQVTLSGELTDQTVNVTAADITLSNIAFIGNATQTGSAFVDYSAAASGLYVRNCVFDFTAATASTSILGLDALGAAAQVCVEDCLFLSDGAFGANLDITATVDSVFRRLVFINQAGTHAANITVGAATDRFLISHCQFVITNAAVVTACIDGTGATIASGGSIQYCTFGDRNTVPIDNFDAAEVEIAENYEAGLGATDGGVLITAIT